MAGKISELDPITGAQLALTDRREVLDVDDFSEAATGKNKGITESEYIVFLSANGLNAGIVSQPTPPTNTDVLWADTNDAGGSPAQTIEAVAETTYTVVAGDANKIKRLAATATVTLPSGGLALGQRVDFVCVGGPATFTLGSGATWDVPPTPSRVARAIGSFVTAIKMGTTSWAITGDLL